MKRFQEHRHALGSEAYFTLVLSDEIDQDLIFVGLWAQTEKFEATFSRFQPTSELSKLNQAAGKRVTVSQEFAAVTREARVLSEKTAGLYNPFVLPNLQRAGYVGSWPELQSATADLNFSHRDVVPISSLAQAEDWVQIPATAALDFGGIGKGYLLDQLADWLDSQHVTDYSLSLGGDIACSGSDITGQPWSVQVQAADSLAASTDVAVIVGTRERQAIATSGTTKRRGEGWHHIINPATGTPADTDILSATVVTQRAMDADVLAKCAVILGSVEAPQLLNSLGCTDYLLQCVDLKQTRILLQGAITQL